MENEKRAEQPGRSRDGAQPRHQDAAAAPSVRGTPLPSIALPKSGGAIRGIGEKVSVHPATGTGSIQVPLAASPGRAELGPHLVLSYDSGAGNGPFGFGWSLGLPAIVRKTDKGLPRYLDDDESDVFLFSGAEDLVPILDALDGVRKRARRVNGVDYDIRCYRPRIEGLFARIERWTSQASGISHWRSITRDNITTLYGLHADSRIADPADARHVFSYRICRTWDDKGNIALYDYVFEDARGIDVNAVHEANRSAAARSTNSYLKRIRYGNVVPYLPAWTESGPETPLPEEWHFEVVFDYGDHDDDTPLPAAGRPWKVRADPFSVHRPGFEVRTYRRCSRVLAFHHFRDERDIGLNCLVRSTDFRYSDDAAPGDPRNPIYTFLASVTQAGYRRDGAGYQRRAMPPLELEYSEPQLQQEVLTLDDESAANLPEGIDGAHYHWVDLDGEGVSGILTDERGGWGYKRNYSPANDSGGHTVRARFGATERVRSLPSKNTLGGGQHLLDLSGNGRLDVVTLNDGEAGFFERTTDEEWEAFRTFRSLPRIDWSQPNLRFVDLTGDGRADVLITEDDALIFHPSLGEEGFADSTRVPSAPDEDRGPRAVFADGTETIFLADMTGDGLTDLARIRNGDVSYWPNLGYGRFGARVTMSNAPRFAADELFDPRRIRLADVDGSGTTDLLYVGDDGVAIAFNRSGNSWADPHRLAVFPAADRLSSVQVLDLLGTGTSCLVWSSPLPAERHAPLRYVDLLGGRKPHLMVRARNNLGAETRLHYAPSTRFYVEDKLDGRPWVTRLPFPVHVVDRIEVYDWIGRSRFVTRYKYHHGYFDGVEREFRGFGMVEQWDTESHRDDTLFPEAGAANEDAASFVPPILTRTWFHTGAFTEAGTLSRQYANEYWTEPTLRDDAHAGERNTLLLPDTVIDDILSADELREAYRALKGSVLRIEVFRDDRTDRAPHPYSVTEQNYSVRLLQRRGRNQHAVFLAHPRESLSFHYERQPADPRITHDFKLEVDDFGNVVRAVTIAYGRRGGHAPPEPSLSAAFQAMLDHDQKRLHVAAVATRYTNAVNSPAADVSFDVYRAPLPCEAITADLSGVTPAAALFAFREIDDAFTTLWSGAHDIEYERIAPTDVDGAGPPPPLGRRIVERSQVLYRSDDLTRLLPPAALESHAFAGETYRLALTATHVRRVFETRANDATLGEAGYVRPPGQSDWWIPSGRVFFSADGAHTPAQELAEARAHFHVVRRAVDPFGAVSVVDWDAHDLLPRRTVDAVGNETLAGNDYRVLHPFVVTDANGNGTRIAFDCLGAVIAAAVFGKSGEGDVLDGFVADLDETELGAVRDLPPDPAPLLGGATSRIVHDRLAYFRTRDLLAPSPVMVYTVTRETHVSSVAAGQRVAFHEAYAYFDGLGREAQQKIQAEPDGARRWIGSGWVVYNNKGQPVRQYEPFFSASHRFEFDRRAGVSSVLCYDPAGRVVATIHPDQTFEKTVFDAWRQEAWDANDTVLIDDPRDDEHVGDFFRRLFGTAAGAYVSWHRRRIGGEFGDTAEDRAAHQDAARKAAAHAATPAVAHFDSLGRTCLTVADNGTAGGIAQRFATRTALDPENKPLAVFDAHGRRAMEYFLRRSPVGGEPSLVAGTDVAGNAVYRISMDGGERRMLHNVAGNPVRSWDARGRAFMFRYDPLQRPTHRFVDGVLFERMIYGEHHPQGDRNLKGRLFRHYDGAGVATVERCDFKHNVVASSRRLTRRHDVDPDWIAIETVAEAPALDVAGLDAATASLLEPDDTFTTFSVFDALDRPIQIVAPHTTAQRPSVIRPRYNEAKALDGIDVWPRQPRAPAALLDPGTADVHAIVNIDYNARGQRLALTLGNGSVTTYAHDVETFRLATLVTVRPHANPDARTVQALTYAYDPAGNITRLRDDADLHNVVYFDNQRVDPSADYTYDSLYRLTAATGREHLGRSAAALRAPVQPDAGDAPRVQLLHPGDGNAVGNYTETYAYDPVGNLLEVVHQVSSGSWTRRHAYAEASRIVAAETSDRLSASSVPGDDARGPFGARYAYDAHGNTTAMHLPAMTWDAQDRLRSTSRQVVRSGRPETTWYVYDSGGERVRKVTDRAAADGADAVRKSERIYFGAFELYREFDARGNVAKTRESIHVLDGHQRAALIEQRTSPDEGPRLTRYQYGNHLGSAMVELDEHAEVISYEEYFPYGSTSYHAARADLEAAKRFRYTSKERDEENDLYYLGARYYAPWIGRWISCDPTGMADGTNLYHYASCNPIRFVDPEGTQARPPVPVPGQTPFNFVSEGPSLRNWQEAANQVLERRFHGGSVAENMRLFEQHVATLPQGTGRTAGTQSNYARNIYNQVRNRFYRLEGANPSFAYSPAERGNLLRGRAPTPGFQLHHMELITDAPGRAVSAGNIVMTQGGATGGLTPGTGHYELHYGEGAQRLRAATPAAASHLHLPPGGSAAAAETSRTVRALSRARTALGTAGRAIEEAAPTLSRMARTGARGGARVLGAIGRVAGPLAIAESGYRLATANNNLDRIQAGADYVSGVAAYTGPVGEAFSLGYGAGQLLDAGVQHVTGESLSSRGARGMAAIGRAVSSVLPSDSSTPAYRRENRVAWWLIDTFNL